MTLLLLLIYVLPVVARLAMALADLGDHLAQRAGKTDNLFSFYFFLFLAKTILFVGEKIISLGFFLRKQRDVLAEKLA